MGNFNLKNFLDIYNSTELNNINELPNTIVQIFSSNAFDDLSYKKYIKFEEDVTKYVDEMHEYKKEIKKYTFSEEEFNFLKDITVSVENIQNKLEIKKKILPYSSLISSLGIIRIMNMLPINKKNLNVFEIGPGSGYTGAMIIKNNHNYFAVENTQGFYMWQSFLYKELNDNFQEDLLIKKNIDIDQKITHIPWWEFSKFFEKFQKLDNQIDLIICDHALAEVNKECLKYIAILSKSLLNEKNYAPLFLVRTFGAFINSNYWEILKVFNDAGFMNIQFSNFIIFIPKNSKLANNLNIKNFIPKNLKPGLLKNKFYLILNRLYQFQILKFKKKLLYKLKNFDNKKSNTQKYNYLDLYKYIKKKDMLCEKYRFLRYIHKDLGI